MVSAKVFLMIQFEAVISRGRKLHLLGIFYFNSFYMESVAENEKKICFLNFLDLQIAACAIGMCHSPKQKLCGIR